MASKQINLTALDFDGIKTNLKTFLQGQTQFQDYDFNGSGMSVLLDVLAYNTHYNSLYNNLTLNEMFLDSARKRDSVVSLAKTIGYTPRSATCATALVNITASSSVIGPAIISLPAYSAFVSNIDGNQYIFYNRASYTAAGPGYSYTFPNVVLTEGTPVTNTYTVTSTSSYIVPNRNADLTTLRVSVYDSIAMSTVSTFTLADNIANVDSTSKVFWIKEIDNNQYQIIFGNGVIGLPLQLGNVIKLEYMVSSLEAPNGARIFTYDGSTSAILSASSLAITTVSSAANGSLPEDIDSIRFNAPRLYTAQNRAVTANDYQSLILSSFPSAYSVSAWGGEDNTPPVYGKVFICVKPTGAEILTSQQKTDIKNIILANKNVVTVQPEIVDPEYIDILLTTMVYYDRLSTSKSPSDIENLVKAALITYNDSTLQRFDGVFRYSKVSNIIDTACEGIVSNITRVILRRKITPKFNISAQYTINLVNPIYFSGVPEDMVKSSGFYITGSDKIHYLVDDGVGNIQLFYIATNRVIVDASVGTVNYAKGLINIRNLNISGIVGSELNLTIKPSSNDVITAYTQIARISVGDMSITAIEDKTTTGDLRGGNNFVFTTSRI